MKRFCPAQLLLLLPLLSFLPSAKTQSDAHYWTHQYGAKGLLLNGAVIASTEDETAVFYNPGAMGNGEDFGISLSFFTPQYAILRTENYLGNGSEASDRGFGFSSDLSAIGFRPFKDHRFRASITSFARYKSGLSLRERSVGRVVNQPDLLFLGNLDFKRSLGERWFGVGLAMKISEKLSVGFSQFAAFHSENTSLSIRKEIVDQNNPTGLLLGWRSHFKYAISTKGSLLTKLGLSAELGKLKFGITATTPTYYHLQAKGSYETDDLRTFGSDSTVLVSNLDGAALEDFKTPWSVGIGLDFRIKRTRVSLSAEYFEKIPRYIVIDDVDDPFDGLAGEGTEQKTSVEYENRPVFNTGFGLQTLLHNDRTTLIWGFRTDFNQRKVGQNLQTLNFLSTTPSVFHFSFGVFSNYRNNQFSLGLDYSFGRKKTFGRLADLSDITPDNLFSFSDIGSITSRYQSVVFIFTYDFIVKTWRDRKNWKTSQEAKASKAADAAGSIKMLEIKSGSHR